MSESEEISRALSTTLAELRAAPPSLGALIEPCVAVLIVDMETEVIAHSTPMAESMFGYIAGELIGKNVHELIPEELKQRHGEHFKSYAADPKVRQMGTVDMMLHGRKRDGSTFPVEISLYPRALHGRRYVVATLLPSRTEK
jgi:PAS domain S-box-containing protein